MSINSKIAPSDPASSGVSRRELLAVSGGVLAAASLAGLSQAAGGQAGAQPKADGGVPPARPSLAKAKEAVKAYEAVILRISREVWDKPAVGLKEQDAMEVHLREIEAAGFKIVSRETSGHPTAFVAEWSKGSGGPKIGFLPEYDALPGLGNTAEPAQRPRPDGKTDGHGCGHNCLGAACTGAAFALKAIMQQENLPGTLRIYGCGAEENEGAKVFMAKDGLFSDLDAALAWHPTPAAVAGTVHTAANRKIRITWKGKTAHAGSNPWEGRSALDAAELFTHGLNMMREHVRPTARLHYIYEIAGVAPNVVPEDARIWMTARDAKSEHVDNTVQWLRELADGAALGMQTKALFELPLGMKEMLPNEVIARRVFEHMHHVPLEWTPEEQAFAKACQKAMDLPEAGMPTTVMPFIKDITNGGSSDVGDVSWNTPVSFFGWPTHPIGVSAHTWAVTACGGMSIGDKGTMGATVLLTALGLDLLTEPELRAAAKHELKKRLGGRTYEATLNFDATMSAEIARRFMKGPNDEGLSGIQ